MRHSGVSRGRWGSAIRGADAQQGGVFSYVSLEARLYRNGKGPPGVISAPPGRRRRADIHEISRGAASGPGGAGLAAHASFHRRFHWRKPMKNLTESRHAGSRARRQVGVAIVVALVVAGSAQAYVIADFNAVAARTATPPPGVAYPAVTWEEKRTLSVVDLATVHLAMYDAVVAIDGGYEPYAVVPDSPAAGASSAAAAGAAACTVLAGLFPNRSPEYQSDCAAYRPGAGADEPAERGIALGIEVGQRMLVERAGDGRDFCGNYVAQPGPGRFVPAAAGNPIWHFAPFMRTLAIGGPAQFRAEGPPDLGSAGYAEAYEEVRQLGRAGGAMLSARQQDIARFHTENPNLFWPRASRAFMNQPSVLENARLVAALQVSIGDAALGCFDSKYHFDFWRPRTAIPAAGGDGNPATVAEPGWAPFAATPNHPEYPSGHSCIAGALAEVIKWYHGTPQVAFSWDSTATGTTHDYRSVHEMIREIKDARVYGGMQFRFSNDDGITLGRRTAHWITKRFFRPDEAP
jgi:hypothetical protein